MGRPSTGTKVGGAVAKLFDDRFVDVGVLDLCVFDFDFQVLILAELEFGQDLERWRGISPGPLSVKSTLIDLRLRDRHQLAFGHRALDLFGHERIAALHS